MFSPDRKEVIEDQIEELREIEIYSLLRERERERHFIRSIPHQY